MKKLLALLMAGMLVLSACGSTETETEEATPAAETETESTETETTEPEVAEEEAEEVVEEEEIVEDSTNSLEIGKTVEIGEWAVTPTEFKLVKDVEGLDGLRVTYTAENLGAEDNTPGFALIFRGFQGGVETGDEFFISDDVDFGIGQATLKQGGKLEGIHDVIDIKDLSKPLLIELSETFSFDNVKFETTIEDLSQYK